MATRILVMSPLHNLGQTVCSIMFAQGATYEGKVSMLLATNPDTPIKNYMGMETENDPTRSVMQIVKLIDAGSIQDRDILDYAIQYTKGGYYLDTSDKSLVGLDRVEVLTHMFSRSPCDLVVMDTDYDVDDQETIDLLEVADAVFLVTDMSDKGVRYMKAWTESKTLKEFQNCFCIVNKYDETVMATREFAKRTPFTANRVCKLHYNPWISKCCLSSTLGTVLPLAKQLDYRVAQLSIDVTDLTNCAFSVEAMKVGKKRGF